MADFTALKNSIQTYIKQNGNEEITGEKLQEILLSVVTTLGDSAINDLITALANEVAARQNADGTLQQNITNEATARGNADTALGGRIDDEATARANGDMALSNRLGSTITAENTAADQIGAEAEARAAADTALQELIDGITDNIENGYVYAGIATPSSTPATGKVFYLALTAGTYTNFGNTVVSQGINILKYNGSAWSLDAFIGIDDELTPGSNNLPKSGNVLENIIKNGSAFDLSAYNAVDGVPATYADLDAALTALNALPAVYKQGGMSFRFVLTSDNKYVQYRLMTNTFSTSVANWQGVDDEPTAGSDNLVKSGGVFPTFNAVNKALIPINGKVSIIGDSISTYDGTMPSGYVAYYPQQSRGVISLYDMWWHLLLSMTKSKLEVNASWSGSRVTNGRSGEGYPDFYDRTNILGTPDYIFVELGSNDSYASVALGNYDYDSENLSESEFIPAYIKGVKALKTNYPNAKIVLFIFPMSSNSYADAIKNIGKHYELDVIDVRSYYANDNEIHPNKLQMCSVAQTISSFYIRGKCDNEPTDGSGNLVKSGGVKTQLDTINEFISNKGVILNAPKGDNFYDFVFIEGNTYTFVNNTNGVCIFFGILNDDTQIYIYPGDVQDGQSFSYTVSQPIKKMKIYVDGTGGTVSVSMSDNLEDRINKIVSNNANVYATTGKGTKTEPYGSPSGTGGIQEAINTLQRGGKIVISPNDYQILSSISLNGSSKRIVGDSQAYQADPAAIYESENGSKLKLGNAAIPTIVLNNLKGGEVADIGLYGTVVPIFENDEPVDTGIVNAFDPLQPLKNCGISTVQHCDQIKLQRICFAQYGAGIVAENLDGSVLKELNFDGCDFGIYQNLDEQDWSGNNHFTNLIFSDMTGRALSIGRIDRSDFSFNNFQSVAGGSQYQVESLDNIKAVCYFGYATQCVFIGNMMYNPGSAGNVKPTINGDAIGFYIKGDGNLFSDNTFSAIRDYFLYMIGDKNVVRGNSAVTVVQYGLKIEGDENLVADNIVMLSNDGGQNYSIEINGDNNSVINNVSNRPILINGDNNTVANPSGNVPSWLKRVVIAEGSNNTTIIGVSPTDVEDYGTNTHFL